MKKAAGPESRKYEHAPFKTQTPNRPMKRSRTPVESSKNGKSKTSYPCRKKPHHSMLVQLAANVNLCSGLILPYSHACGGPGGGGCGGMNEKCTGPSIGEENCEIEAAGVPIPPGAVVTVMLADSSSCHLRAQCRAGQRSGMP